MKKELDGSETKRLQALKDYDVLDTEPEASFDRITRLAQTFLKVPIVLVSLVDRDRQWFKSRQGLAVAETSRELSFCAHAIQGNQPFVVQDATQDNRFSQNPLVCGEPGIRSYVGIPLCTPSGYNLGTLCAIDLVPRDFAPSEIGFIHDLAGLVVHELELRRIATTDSLTGLCTRRSFEAQAATEFKRARRYGRALSCVTLDVDHFKIINDSYGHAGGDAVLRYLATKCLLELRSVDIVGRLGGEEFAIIMPETKGSPAAIAAERLRQLIACKAISFVGANIDFTASFGVAELMGDDRNFGDVLKRADEALYEAKGAGRNCTVLLDDNGAQVLNNLDQLAPAA